MLKDGRTDAGGFGSKMTTDSADTTDGRLHGESGVSMNLSTIRTSGFLIILAPNVRPQ
jgi:hypothetical protein